MISVIHPLCVFSMCTSASRHVFVAQQAVMWAAAFGHESAIISVLYLQPALSMLQPKPAAWPNVTATPYICPPALCPSPTVLGTVGVGRTQWQLQGWLEGIKRPVMSDGGRRLVWSKLIYKVSFSGLEEVWLLEIFIPSFDCV